MFVKVLRLLRKTGEPLVLWTWLRQGTGTRCDEPGMDLLWHSQVRRFHLAHTLRFVKQTLNGVVLQQLNGSGKVGFADN